MAAWQQSGLAGPIGIFPIVRNPGVAEHKAHQIGEARLSANIVGEKQHDAAQSRGRLPELFEFVDATICHQCEEQVPILHDI